MKKYITIILTIITVTCYSQVTSIVPLNHPIEVNMTNGTYYQDDEFDFNPYIGTWQGTWGTGINAKTFILKVEKITQHFFSQPDNGYYYSDILIGKYTVLDASESIINSTMNVTNPNLAKLISKRTFGNRCYFTYNDTDLCNIYGTVGLKLDISNPNILNYIYRYEEFWLLEDCQYYGSPNGIPIPIPTISLILTKIN
jgi:hypothetical protein